MSQTACLFLLSVFLAGATAAQKPYGPQSAQISGTDEMKIGVSYSFECSAECYPPCTYTWNVDGQTVHGSGIDFSVPGYTPPQVLNCVAKNPATGETADVKKTVQVKVVKEGPTSVEITGVDVMTVGVKYTFECSADCSPPCTYTFNVNGQILHGNELDVVMHGPSAPQVLVCEAKNPATGKTARAKKIVDVTESAENTTNNKPYGPRSLKISGADVVTEGVKSTFLCSAECYPYCTYTWNVNGQILHGNGIDFTAGGFMPQILNCEATNPTTGETASINKTVGVTDRTVSEMPPTVATKRPYGPHSLEITGADVIKISVSNHFTCSAECYPPCTYTWNVDGSIVHGSQMDLTIPGPAPPQVLYCEAKNPLTGKTANITKRVPVSDAIEGPTSVEITGVDVITVGVHYTYECSAECSPSCTYTWTVNGQQTLHGSMVIDVVMDGLAAPQVLNCEVTNIASGKTVSVTKTMPVADGPSNVTISAPEKLVNGVECTFVCSAICDPSCSYDWFIDHKTWKNDSRELQYTPPSDTKSATVICKAQNTLSGLFVESSVTVSVEGEETAGEKPKSTTTTKVPYGPQSVKISGADAITVGVSYNFTCSAKCYPPCTYTMSIDGATGHGDYIGISIGGPAAPQFIGCVAKNPATGVFASTSKTVRVADINVGPIHVEIKGMDVVSVGVPSTFDCSAECSPACTYTWNVNGETVHRYSQIDVVLHEGSTPWTTLPLSCEVRNPATGKTVTVSKTVPVAEGPLNVSIAAHKTLVNGDEYTFVCSVASCHPSCIYSWFIGDQTWANITNELQYTAPSNTKTTVTCKAQNTLSGIYVESTVTFSLTGGTASQELERMNTNTPYGPQFLKIIGEDVLTIGLPYSFVCAAECYPPCTYTWNVNGKIIPGSVIDFTFSGQSLPEVLNCVAKNPASGKTASVNRTVQASDIKEGTTSVEITGVDVVTVKVPTSFECFANCSPACTYSWSVEGEISHGSSLDFVLPQLLPPQDLTQNLTLTLNCEAKNPATGQTASVSRTVQVAEGPLNVSLTAPTKLVIGAEATFVCSAFCYPSCTYDWLIDDQTWKTGGSELQFTTPADIESATVICKAQNILSGLIAESAVTVWVEEGPKSVKIEGVDVVTVGVPYTFECLAYCSPPCTFTWNVAGKTVQGNKLDFYLRGLSPPQALSCEAKNPMTGKTASFTKILQVAEGPLNVSITAPKMLANGVESTFVCSAVCYPSCNYSWYIGDQTRTNSRKLHYTAPPETTLATVICKAQNTLSGLFVESISNVWMAQGPKDVTIKGPSSVIVGNTFSYYCLADCVPACNITWRFEGRTLTGESVSVPILQGGEAVLGNRLVISVEDYIQTELLQCTAVNILSGQSETVMMAINVTDPIAVQPNTEAQPRTNRLYSLQCAGAEQGSYIQWTRNGEALSTSVSVHLSDDNVFLIFDPLHPFDTGVYQCIVTEQGKVIPGIPYELNVIYGPGTPDIASISGGKILRQKPIDVLRLLPGSSATLHCSSQCYPACTYEWTLGDKVVSTNATFSIRSASEADVGVLLCTASNPDVHTVPTSYTSASLSIELIDGPKTVTITGPSSVQVGVTATFECSAVCTTFCFYTWEIYGKTLHGSKVDLTLSKYAATETIVCKAENTFTGKIATATATIDLTDPDWCGC
ncbi:hypothetical protein AALO_G00111440 [Alosa alosa]|uniref:Ig-like domain-containing protein n=1 Tax=Alosa alosa TaxID=278164 RepID=A0AAV6GQ09_9TELE|nr:hemicentin-1-like isoform X2 [Alosa alosa]KAG5276925.1 hypothetical protein AALO_G00111440 [Alosa alosa]